MSLDNRRGELEPTKAYDIGTSWDLSDKFIEKYFGNYLEKFNSDRSDINIEKMQKYIWNNCMTKEEKEEEIQKMTEFYWLNDKDNRDWLQECIKQATREIERELEEIKRREGYEY